MRTASSSQGISTSLPHRRFSGPVKTPAWQEGYHCTVDEQKDELGGRSAVSLILREKKILRNLQKHAENQKRILRNVDLEICTFHIVIYFARSRR